MTVILVIFGVPLPLLALGWRGGGTRQVDGGVCRDTWMSLPLQGHASRP
jgi:hypothetical protein